MLRFTPLAALIGAALSFSVQAADTAAAPVPQSSNTTQLPGVQVTASTPSVLLNVPGTTTVIGRQQMDRHLVTNIRDMVRYEPGVSAIGTAGRFGLDSFNIRGLSGNRTRIEIDGVSLPDSFGADVAGGSFRAGRNFIDLDEIKQVEIVRGPSSALYPSDALGGVVSLITKDPADCLRPGKDVYTSLKEQYDGTDRSFSTTATLAGGDQRNGILFVFNHRSGHETEDMGDVGGTGNARTRPDPQTYDLNSFLGKYVHTADSGRTDRFIVDGSQMNTRTDGLSELTPSFGVAPDYYYSQDENMRVRASVGQSFPLLNSALADTLDWNAYWQKSITRTHTQTDYGVIDRYFDSLPLQEKVFGGKLVAVKHLGETGAVNHTLSYGVELSRTNAQSNVGGYGVNTLTGAVGSSDAFMPGNYPLHLIPNSDTYRYSLFGQDEIALLDDRLTITPGLRADRYEYKPDDDPLYLKYNNGYVQQNYEQNHVSPKLGVIWHFTDSLSAYANFDYGFRPPLYSEIAGSWNEQPVAGINIAYLPNPNLKAETSRGAEFGIRGKGDAGWFNADGYYNSYRNFIWSGYALAPNAVPSWAYQISPGAFFNEFFQAVNARKAYIKGLEATGVLQLGHFSDALKGWSLKGSAALATGRLIQPGDTGYTPLNTVDPAKLVAGISYDSDHWGAELVGTAVRRHTRLSDPTAFRPPGYGTLDFYAHYAPIDSLELYAGVSNLTNRKYWDWGNLNSGALGNLISGNGLNDAGTGGLPADRFTMPGRTFSVAARFAY
jgi:hemoglobin/transferrin/lactoferrin receptor protein